MTHQFNQDGGRMDIPEVIYLQTGDSAEHGEADGPVMHTEDMTWCIEPIYEHDTKYVRADLAAAAPELLEALRRSLNWLSSYPGGLSLDAYDQARAAIDKAEGR